MIALLLVVKIVVEGGALSRVTNALYGFHKEVGTRCNRAPDEVLYFIIHLMEEAFKCDCFVPRNDNWARSRERCNRTPEKSYYFE